MSKAPNYTPEQVEVMTGMYLGVIDESDARRDEVVDEIADIYDRKRRSIIAKLSNLKIYKAKTVVKSGTAIRKETAAADLRDVTGLPLVSAENLTKVDILALTDYIENLQSEIRESE